MRIYNLRICNVLVLVVLTILMSQLACAITATIGNPVEVVYTEVEQGRTTVLDKFVVVINRNEIPVKVTLTPYNYLKGRVDILDNNFVLESNATFEARFTAYVSDPGLNEGKMIVSFAPASGGSSVSLASKLIFSAKQVDAVSEGIVTIPLRPVENDSVNGTNNNGTNTNSTTQNNQNQTNNNNNSQGNKPIHIPEQLIGILIVVGIVVAGLVIYFLIRKRWQ